VDLLRDAPQFLEFLALVGIALLVGVVRWAWVMRMREGARLRRVPFFRPGYTLTDGVGWARLEVRGPPLAATILVLGVGLVGLGLARRTPALDGWTSTARTAAELVVTGMVAVIVGVYAGSGRLDVRLEAGEGLEVRRSGPFRRAEVWRVGRPRTVSLLVEQAGALELEVQYEESGADGVVDDQRFFFVGQFDDDDPVLDKDLAAVSETFTAIASSGERL